MGKVINIMYIFYHNEIFSTLKKIGVGIGMGKINKHHPDNDLMELMV